MSVNQVGLGSSRLRLEYKGDKPTQSNLVSVNDWLKVLGKNARKIACN